MKKFIFSFFLSFFTISFALAKNNDRVSSNNLTHSNQKHESAIFKHKSDYSLNKKTSSFFELRLLIATEDCGAGYYGTRTFWLVYDSNTGGVAGYGEFRRCIPISMA